MANEYIRKSWKGGALGTTITAGISGSALSITLTAATTWPDGSAGPFVVVLDRGTGLEEKIIVTSRTGNTLSVLSRGYDGTPQSAHALGAAAELCIDAYTIEQMNILATTMNQIGDILYKSAAGVDNTTFARLPIGAANTVMRSTGSAPSWGQVQTNDVADSAITSLKIADGTIVNGDIAAAGTANIAHNKLANGTAGQLLMANASGVITGTAMSGDVAISSAGATTIQPLAVSLGKIGAGLRPIQVVTSTTRPTANEGDLIYETDTQEILQAFNSVGAWRRPWRLPWGWIQTGASTTPTNSGVSGVAADIGVSASFTAVANRLYKVSFQAVRVTSAAGSDVEVQITNAANVVQAYVCSTALIAAGGKVWISGWATFALAAGAQTIKIRAFSANANVAVFQSGGFPSSMVVEDIGAIAGPA